jgi:hypothetical protein
MPNNDSGWPVLSEMVDLGIEPLLHEDESSSLDFKRDQYDFDHASDDKKGELLKDVLAFANAWRRSEAYILIGVDEVRGGRSRPVGVDHHLDDATLQQFVNSKTQKPIVFAYRVQRVDDVEIGVISIAVQDRPFFLRRDFGRLKKDTVYLRQGSSTNTADPDEIVRMGLSTNQAAPPMLSVVATVLNAYKGEFVVGVSNAVGSGVARAPYLELDPPGPFMLGQYGLDGNGLGNHGLPLLPRGAGSTRQKFAGTADVVLHPGTSRDVTRIDWHGAQGKVPPHIDLPYAVGADGVAVAEGTIRITFSV